MSELKSMIEMLTHQLEGEFGKDLAYIDRSDILIHCAEALLKAQQQKFVLTIRQIEFPKDDDQN